MVMLNRTNAEAVLDEMENVNTWKLLFCEILIMYVRYNGFLYTTSVAILNLLLNVYSRN
jgi:hypothetical protein